jgi:hypothetical protein
MSVEQDIRDLLAADAGVTALLGAGTALRVYPQAAPQKPLLPYVTYYRVSTSTGPVAALDPIRSNLEWARITFEAWSDSYLTAKSVDDAIRLALDGARSGDILACRRLDGRDLYEPETQPKPLHRVGGDYLVTFKL